MILCGSFEDWEEEDSVCVKTNNGSQREGSQDNEKNSQKSPLLRGVGKRGGGDSPTLDFDGGMDLGLIVLM